MEHDDRARFHIVERAPGDQPGVAGVPIAGGNVPPDHRHAVVADHVGEERSVLAVGGAVEGRADAQVVPEGALGPI